MGTLICGTIVGLNNLCKVPSTIYSKHMSSVNVFFLVSANLFCPLGPVTLLILQHSPAENKVERLKAEQV